MAGGVALATAYVTLIPSLKGAKGKIGEQVAPEGEAAGGTFAQRFAQVAIAGLKIAAAEERMRELIESRAPISELRPLFRSRYK